MGGKRKVYLNAKKMCRIKAFATGSERKIIKIEYSKNITYKFLIIEINPLLINNDKITIKSF
jgi:hypothetical protein